MLQPEEPPQHRARTAPRLPSLLERISIGGATAAIELARAGFDVEVFERSAGNLMDRGAGIGVSVLFLDKMEQRDLIDPGTPSFRVSKRRFVVRSEDRLGRKLWEQRIAF